MSELLKLAERCEAATVTQVPFLLIDAYEAVRGLPYRAEQSRYFRRLIEAEAYLDAAMSLVPEGWCSHRRVNFRDDGKVSLAMFDVHGIGQASVAASEPLALCAAALRARATLTQGEDNG